MNENNPNLENKISAINIIVPALLLLTGTASGYWLGKISFFPTKEKSTETKNIVVDATSTFQKIYSYENTNNNQDHYALQGIAEEVKPVLSPDGPQLVFNIPRNQDELRVSVAYPDNIKIEKVTDQETRKVTFRVSSKHKEYLYADVNYDNNGEYSFANKPGGAWFDYDPYTGKFFASYIQDLEFHEYTPETIGHTTDGYPIYVFSSGDAGISNTEYVLIYRENIRSNQIVNIVAQFGTDAAGITTKEEADAYGKENTEFQLELEEILKTAKFNVVPPNS